MPTPTWATSPSITLPRKPSVTMRSGFGSGNFPSTKGSTVSYIGDTYTTAPFFGVCMGMAFVCRVLAGTKRQRKSLLVCSGNPTDNQGVRFLLGKVRERKGWHE